MTKFKFDIRQDLGSIEIKVVGHLDENFIQSEHTIPNGTLVKFNLDKLEGINSCGIREFINLLKRFPAETQVEYSHCPPFFIQQVNLVNGFLATNRKISSLYVPYIGLESENEVTQFVDATSLKISDVKKVIHINGEDYEFDGFIEKYFRFLTIKF